MARPGCTLVIPNTFIACGEEGHYCSEACRTLGDFVKYAQVPDEDITPFDPCPLIPCFRCGGALELDEPNVSGSLYFVNCSECGIGYVIKAKKEDPEKRKMLERAAQQLKAEADAMFERMQTPEFREGMHKVMNATPEELGKAAVAAAAKKRDK